ncbi:MAG TPA: hypothetical protein VF974_04815 [Patescibacteria group bacterium]
MTEEELSKPAELPNGDETITASDAEKTAPEATAETKSKDETPPVEGDNTQSDKGLPFKDHPRWQEREREWQTKLEQAIGETKAEYEGRIQSLEDKFSPLLRGDIKPSEFFKKVYGDDPELYKEYLLERDTEAQRIKDEAIAEYEGRIEAGRQAVEAENKRWETWVETSVQSLKDSGKTFDENRLKAIAIRDMPTDLNGNIDFTKAYNIMLLEDRVAETEGKKKTDARKELAASTTSTNKGEAPARDYLTHEDIQKGLHKVW